MPNNQYLPPEPAKMPFFKRMEVWVALIIVVIFIALIAGWFVYRSKIFGPEIKKEAGESANVPVKTPEVIARPTNSPDTDKDGLFDAEEARLGTNPSNPDTDSDGLNDFDEINIGTNPKNPDTDGDGHSDGDEVKAGYSPLGPGRLR